MVFGAILGPWPLNSEKLTGNPGVALHLLSVQPFPVICTAIQLFLTSDYDFHSFALYLV